MSCKCYSKSLHYHPTAKLSKSFLNFRWYSFTIRCRTFSDCWTIICSCSKESLFTTYFVINYLSFIIRTKSLIQPFYQGTIYNPTIEQIRILLKKLSSNVTLLFVFPLKFFSFLVCLAFSTLCFRSNCLPFTPETSSPYEAKPW